MINYIDSHYWWQMQQSLKYNKDHYEYKQKDDVGAEHYKI